MLLLANEPLSYLQAYTIVLRYQVSKHFAVDDAVAEYASAEHAFIHRVGLIDWATNRAVDHNLPRPSNECSVESKPSGMRSPGRSLIG